MTPFRLQIVTPDRTVFDGEVEEIIVRTTVGDKGVLARHEPYVAALTIGRLKVKIGGAFRTAAISEGIIKVEKEKTIVLVQSCEWAEEIDRGRAEKAKTVAEERMKNASDRDYLVAEYKLKRAINRIETHETYK